MNDFIVTVREMRDSDPAAFAEAERAQGWLGATTEKLDERMKDCAEGKCAAIVAEVNAEPAGYVSVYWNPDHGPFAGKGWPEIVDFNVLEKYRRRGVGTKLMDAAEALAGTRSDVVTLGVGLHSGYGSAQRMYVKRGYIPDGSGVWYENEVCPEYADCNNGDSLVLYFSKKNRK